jgi:hypothetical protein
MAKKLVPEVLELVQQAKTKQEKVEILRNNAHPALKDILRINFDADVVSLLPEGAPPYRKDDAPEGYSVSSLFKTHKQFKYFFKGPIGDQVQAVRREKLFIDALESMHPTESDLLIEAKDRKLKGITKALVDEAFPGLVVKAVKKPAAKKTTTKKKEK